MMPPKNKSILQFFKPAPATTASQLPQSSPQSCISASPSALLSVNSPRKAEFFPKLTQAEFKLNPEASESGICSSSLFPPLSRSSSELPRAEPPNANHRCSNTDSFESSPEPEVENPPLLATVNTTPENIVQNSEDEHDSDSSFEDLAVLLANRTSMIRATEGKPDPSKTPSTPTRFRYKRAAHFHSPLAVLPKKKYKYDLDSLAQLAKIENATDASSQRAKALLDKQDTNEIPGVGLDIAGSSVADVKHATLLKSVILDEDDGGASKVKRAMARTETNIQQERWYFFEAQETKALNLSRKPFPTASVPKEWRMEMEDSQKRFFAFISGFTEDMISLHKSLPDELFLWMIDAVSWEQNDLVLNSYLSALTKSSQIPRLIDPKAIQNMFRNLGATAKATVVTEKIETISKIPDYYSNHGWSKHRSVISFLINVAPNLHLETRIYVVCLFLRMSADTNIFEKVDLLDGIQETISGMCRYTKSEDWDMFCMEICQAMLHSLQQQILRLQVVESISSVTASSHDLRRRLAMCFLFNDIAYSKDHTYKLMDLEAFIHRLDGNDFVTNSDTDYRELQALILLLDIAVDDGRSSKLDLSIASTESRYNEDVEKLSASIQKIMRGLGTPRTGYISKIQAKEAIETVSKRITDTLRTKPKPVHSWFSTHGRKVEVLEAEKRSMASFVLKMKTSNDRATDNR